MDRDKVEINNNVKEEQGQYPAIIWSIKGLLNGQKREFFLALPTRENNGPIYPACEANQNNRFAPFHLQPTARFNSIIL